MTKLITLALIGLLFSCSPQQNTEEKKEITITKTDTVIVDTIKEETIIEEKCECEAPDYVWSINNSLRFASNNFLEKFAKLTTKEILGAQKIILYNFSKFPKELKKFKNVEVLFLENCSELKNNELNIFPKLKAISYEQCKVDFSTPPKWLNQIEYLWILKTYIKGLQSFKSLPKLKLIDMGYSSFYKGFPQDFESLKCLSKFSFGALINKEKINLSNLDLNKLPCLKYFEVHSWKENIIGIPKGMNKIKTIRINHPLLTKEEKEAISQSRKEYKALQKK